ncbi:hypothetical protein V4Z64_006353 [Pseudomonas aeruginosa]|uniref:hypothetical protein n=1 Tax=Pseudomonas aeruginosa TaxID=287 RepID=UPI0015F0B14D|nr:hypothetical protein [Pseudomonas aeruginosa]MBA5106069.1 hypothetical protein [Pseudomonas aeruginosa]MDP5990004.1 hypothetical protein [Pseudomonas aeruginosa]HCE9175722.1 hypothetical protein [Pseudomonas aeruginosa]HEJ9771291.1 hypothetical protein [Pseudomonas aeruginosa]HEO1611759.1 hypothetical protein [Pseudomonas aeruginosa]
MVDNSRPIAEVVAGFLACGDDRQKWIEVMATIFEHAAELDDLALLRLGRDAERYERDLWSDAPSTQNESLQMLTARGLYRLALELALIESILRRQVLLAYAKALRLMHGEMK